MRKEKSRLPKVSVSITNWNGRDFVIDCLRSIFKQNYPKNLLEAIVVDNASTDGSVEAIKKEFPEVRILVQKKNIGFTAGMNVGLKAARGKYIMILNNDEVLDKNCILELVKIAEKDNKIALAGAKIYSMDNPKEIQSMYGFLNRKTMHSKFVGRGEIDKGQYEDIVDDATFVSFSSIVRNNIIKKIGYMDERYFIYFEDTDLMAKMKDAGYKLVFVPKAKIWHKGAVSLGRENPQIIYYVQRNNLIIRDKFNGFSLLEHLKNFRFLLSLIISSLVVSENRKTEHIMAARGIFDFYRKKFGQASF